MMWLSDYSTPSLEGYHKYEALIGPGQTTGSTGGFDLKIYPSGNSRNFRGDTPILSVNAPVKLASVR